MEHYDYMEQMSTQAYNEIQSKAGSNMLIQGASAIIGGPVSLGVDVAVIGTHYVPMFNRIRGIYGRGLLGAEAITPIVTNIMSECLFDIVHDKVLGNIPLVGIYFNAICAKTMTWRLGILFSMLASRGEEIESGIVKDCMFVIRNMFPQGTAYKFAQPDLEGFIQMVSSVHNNTPEDFAMKINQAKDIFNNRQQ